MSVNSATDFSVFMRLFCKFSLAIAFSFIIIPLSAQSLSDNNIVERSWVKYAVPRDWTVSTPFSSEYDSKGVGDQNRDYIYRTSVNYIREPFVCAIFTKISYPDGSAMIIEDGKIHFINHSPVVSRCLWYNTSDNEVKGLASINYTGFANGAIVERNIYATVFVRKVGNEVYILELKFDRTTTTDDRKPIIDAIYNSWQPIVKKDNQ